MQLALEVCITCIGLHLLLHSPTGRPLVDQLELLPDISMNKIVVYIAQ